MIEAGAFLRLCVFRPVIVRERSQLIAHEETVKNRRASCIEHSAHYAVFSRVLCDVRVHLAHERLELIIAKTQPSSNRLYGDCQR